MFASHGRGIVSVRIGVVRGSEPEPFREGGVMKRRAKSLWSCSGMGFLLLVAGLMFGAVPRASQAALPPPLPAPIDVDGDPDDNDYIQPSPWHDAVVNPDHPSRGAASPRDADPVLGPTDGAALSPWGREEGSKMEEKDAVRGLQSGGGLIKWSIWLLRTLGL